MALAQQWLPQGVAVLRFRELWGAERSTRKPHYLTYAPRSFVLAVASFSFSRFPQTPWAQSSVASLYAVWASKEHVGFEPVLCYS